MVNWGKFFKYLFMSNEQNATDFGYNDSLFVNNPEGTTLDSDEISQIRFEAGRALKKHQNDVVFKEAVIKDIQNFEMPADKDIEAHFDALFAKVEQTYEKHKESLSSTTTKSAMENLLKTKNPEELTRYINTHPEVQKILDTKHIKTIADIEKLFKELSPEDKKELIVLYAKWLHTTKDIQTNSDTEAYLPTKKLAMILVNTVSNISGDLPHIDDKYHRDAIYTLQFKLGVKEDGAFGPLTLAALLNNPALALIPKNNTPSPIVPGTKAQPLKSAPQPQPPVSPASAPEPNGKSNTATTTQTPSPSSVTT